jgi:hypothetical protein
MQKIFIALGLFFLAGVAKAQNGFERMIVEKYYVSDAADAAASVGTLPIGSVTYRIFIDMQKGYNFQAAFAETGHQLKIATTTTFFNNEDRGAATPNGISVVNVKKNTVMLDSWLSVGASATGKMAVPKSDDTDGSIFSTSTILGSTDLTYGASLKTADGMVTGSPQAVTVVGFDPLGDLFDAASQFGGSFVLADGAWSALSGAQGANADSNKVLIGQFTTDGVFSFELNFQLGAPDLSAHKFYAKAPAGDGTVTSSLNYSSDVISAVTELDKTSSFRVFPNPANDVLTIDILNTNKSKDFNCSIYTIDGRMVYQNTMNNVSDHYNAQIDISALSSGQYFLQMTSGDLTSTQKIIKIQ